MTLPKIKLERIQKEFMWLEVIYPHIYSLILLTFVSYLLYSGQIVRRIATIGEKRYLESSLRIAKARFPQKPELFSVISLKESDGLTLDISKSKNVVDASLKDYGNIISNVLKGNPKKVFVFLPLIGKPTNIDFSELTDILKKHNSSQTVVLGMVHDFFQKAPDQLKQNAIIKQHELLYFKSQITGVYIPQIKNFFYQYLAEIFAKHVLSTPNTPYLSNIFSNANSYINYLTDSSLFGQYSFSDIYNATDHQLRAFENQYVFIGNSIKQHHFSNFADTGSNALRVETTLTPDLYPSSVFGEPIHIFWAQMASTLFEQDFIGYIKANTLAWVALVIAFVVGYITLSTHYFFVPLLIPLILFFLFPFLNAFFIVHYRFYLPPFNIVALASFTAIFSIFFRLSKDAYFALRKNLATQFAKHVADLKANFISLVSHNLNTPVAKMSGLVDMLEQIPNATPDKESFQLVKTNISEIQMSIKGILVLNALSENRTNLEANSLNRWIKNHRQDHKKTNCSLKLDTFIFVEPSEFNDIPIKIDIRSLQTILVLTPIIFKCNNVSKINPCINLTCEPGILESAWSIEIKECANSDLRLKMELDSESKMPTTVYNFLKAPDNSPIDFLIHSQLPLLQCISSALLVQFSKSTTAKISVLNEHAIELDIPIFQ